jgi:hypothetical protein
MNEVIRYALVRKPEAKKPVQAHNNVILNHAVEEAAVSLEN